VAQPRLSRIRALRRTVRQTFGVTSALLFVAVLALVDLSYRRWMRRSISRRMNTTVDLEGADAAIIPMPAREQRDRDSVTRAVPIRELSSPRDERRSS
jgi:hypothetical protein